MSPNFPFETSSNKLSLDFD